MAAAVTARASSVQGSAATLSSQAVFSVAFTLMEYLLSRGKTYWYCPIQASVPNSTDEQTPEGRFVISNVTRAVAPYLKMVDREYPKITVEVVNSRGVGYTLFRPGTLVGIKNEDFSDTGWTGRIEKIDGETIAFDRDLPEQKGLVYVLYDHAFATENFLVKDCRFHDSAGSRIVVQGNNITFDGCSFGPMRGTPLKFASCYSYNVWCEGIGCTNIVVRNCRFVDCVDKNAPDRPATQIHAVLSIPPDGYHPQKNVPIANDAFAAEVESDRASGRKVAPSPRGVADILVEGCTFVNPPGYVFYAKNGSGFTLRGNKVEWGEMKCEKLPFAGEVRLP